MNADIKITKKLGSFCGSTELVISKIKDYGTKFSMYQVSKLVNGVKIPLYKECYSDFDIAKIIENGSVINYD